MLDCLLLVWRVLDITQKPAYAIWCGWDYLKKLNLLVPQTSLHKDGQISFISQQHNIVPPQILISNSPNPPYTSCRFRLKLFFFFNLRHLFLISSPAPAKDHGTSPASPPIHFICHCLMVMTPEKDSWTKHTAGPFGLFLFNAHFTFIPKEEKLKASVHAVKNLFSQQ